VKGKMGGESNRESSSLSLKADNPSLSLKADSPEEEVRKLKQQLESSKKYNYATYMLRDRDLKEILCFEGVIPKNLLVFRLAKLFRNLSTAEILVFRLVELKLYEEVVIDSYPTIECKKVCVERKKRKCVKKEEVCNEVNKDIFGLMPSEELAKVCSQSYI
jgi:hypothetical protein